MFQKKIEKKKEIYKGDTLYFRRLFLKSCINLPEFPSRQQIVARILLEEKLFFLSYRATSIRITFPVFQIFHHRYTRSITPLQYTIHPSHHYVYSHLEYHHLRIIILFARNNPYPSKLPAACPPLFPLLLSSSSFPDSLPLWFTANFPDFADGRRENGGHVSKNERVGLFETWIIGWRTVLYIMSGAGRGLKTFSRSRNSRRTAASSLTSHSCKYFIDTRAIREKSARKSPLLFSIGEREKQRNRRWRLSNFTWNYYIKRSFCEIN